MGGATGRGGLLSDGGRRIALVVNPTAAGGKPRRLLPQVRAELDRQRALIEQQSEAIAELRHTLDSRLAALDRGRISGLAQVQ